MRPQSRPTRERVIRLLEKIRDARDCVPGDDTAALAQVNVIVARDAASRESKEEEARLKREERANLIQQARSILKDRIVEHLVRKICDAAPEASRRDNGSPVNWSIEVTLSNAKLTVRGLFASFPEGPFEGSGWNLVAGAQIAVATARGYEWAASLWYGTTGKWDGYRWFEVAYFTNPLLRRRGPPGPFALTNPTEAAEVARPAIGRHCLAYPPRPIDDEDEADFCRRWIALFAKAAKGELEPPRELPLPDSFFAG